MIELLLQKDLQASDIYSPPRLNILAVYTTFSPDLTLEQCFLSFFLE